MPYDRERNYDSLWWNADKGEVFETLFQQITEVTNRQAAIYDRFFKLEASYDPNNLSVANQYQTPLSQDISENLIASNVDTVASAIAATDVLPDVETDGGDWSQQRRARHLAWYAEGLVATYQVNQLATMQSVSAAKKGSGFVFVTLDQWDQPQAEYVMADDVVVDELETRYGLPPRFIARRKSNISKEQLKAEFPQFSDEIDRAGPGRGRDYLRRGGYVQTRAREVVELEAWFRPIGRRGAKGYKPGRHVRCIDGCDLIDEPYHKKHFPVSKMDWTRREGGYFGISLAERIWGFQRVVNKRHWQVDRIIDQNASPTRWIRPVDAKIMSQTHDTLGTFAVVKGDIPVLETPSPVSPQIIEHGESMAQKSFQESGVSRMAAQSVKPAGLDSGRALREYRDQTTQRFSLQEEAYERAVLEIVWLLIDLCKDLGDRAPKVLEGTKFADRSIDWAKVDMDALRVQLVAKSSLNRTQAGREQTVLEWAQAGIISQDEARRLMQHPDLDRAMSLYTAAIEHVEWCLEQIADGVDIVPEPFANLEMIVWRGQMQYLNWVTGKAPESVLEEVRRFVVTAAWQIAQKNPANANAMPGAGAAAAGPDPTQSMPQGMPPLPGGPPSNQPATAAFSPQAMQLVAGAG